MPKDFTGYSPDVDFIKERVEGYIPDVTTLLTRHRYKGVWVDGNCLDKNRNYIEVSPKDEAIIADLIIHNENRELAVRATYRIPPYEAPYIFYHGYDLDEVVKAFEKVFSSKLEEIKELETNWKIPNA